MNKTIGALITSIIIYIGIIFTVAAQDSGDIGCLETVWKRTNPTEAEKQFDIENDKGILGGLFSCEYNVSATQVQSLLDVLKAAAETGDAQELSTLLIYPQTYMAKLKQKDRDGNIYEFILMENEIDFISLFDKITADPFKDIISCTRLSNLDPIGQVGIHVASGYIRFKKSPKTNQLKISELNTLTKSQNGWLNKYCNQSNTAQ